MSTEAARQDTAVLRTIQEIVDNAGVATVFGVPIEKEGITVLPVAKVSGGGGGGAGTGPAAQGKETGGTGGGVGVSAKGLGVFVIQAGRVGWRPAVDVNRLITGGQIVAVAALLAVRAIARGRRGRLFRRG